MLSKVRAAMTGLVGSKSTKQSIKPDVCQQDKEPPKTEIPSPRVPCRPGFLSLTPEELQASGDHTSRIILSPKNPGELHWGTGYAEVVNAGKSLHNEDQACCEYITVEMRDGKSNDCLKEFPESGQSIIQKQESLDQVDHDIGFSYWGLFDGHAGCGCAMFAAKLLHFHVCDQLRDLVSILRQPVATPAPLCLVHVTTENAAGTPKEKKTQPPLDTELRFHLEKQVFPESLVIGALENAFREMDKQIETERTTHKIDGGCCALVAVHLMGKIYVANAGDSRAIIIRQGKPIPMSQEFTPETERQRVQFLGFLKPELLGNEFTCLEFPRRIQQKELKKRMLYRDHTMTGWLELWPPLESPGDLEIMILRSITPTSTSNLSCLVPQGLEFMTSQNMNTMLMTSWLWEQMDCGMSSKMRKWLILFKEFLHHMIMMTNQTGIVSLPKNLSFEREES
ncbi:protein phosphatase 1J isoform X2 [Pelobates fuscus]|uniref:protein phosphatase 1J isoform X2 n=1 Tax=Pelobates fuscus TaxID=191477 RepID=UPI002FE4591C